MTLSRDLRGSTDWSYCLPLNGLANCKSLGRVLHARGRKDICTAAVFVAIEDSKVAQWGRISAQKLDTRDPLSPSLDPVVVQSLSAAIYRVRIFDCRHSILQH